MPWWFFFKPVFTSDRYRVFTFFLWKFPACWKSCQATVSWKDIFLLSQLLYSFSSLILLSCITLRLLALQKKKSPSYTSWFPKSNSWLQVSVLLIVFSKPVLHLDASIFYLRFGGFHALNSGTYLKFYPGNNEVITRLKENMKALHYNFKMVVCILRNQPGGPLIQEWSSRKNAGLRSGWKKAFGKTRDHGWGKVAAKSSVNSSYPWLCGPISRCKTTWTKSPWTSQCYTP